MRRTVTFPSALSASAQDGILLWMMATRLFNPVWIFAGILKLKRVEVSLC